MSTLDTLPGVTRLRCPARLEDVFLPGPQWGRLKELREAAGAGRAVALFAGPPGTGKTFAALALANELGAELYKVDLAAFTSKYIGETEKNLAAVFERAEQRDIVLAFDEADALFGKRTEVRDAHDRYANASVGFLLQRLEEAPGLSILASNHAEPLDPSFLQRVDVVIDFPLPDAERRAQMWKRYLPGDVAADVSIERLAARLELCGRTIRNATRRAREIAEDLGRPVGLREVGAALREVVEEDEGRPAAAHLGPLSDMLRDAR